MDKLLLEDILKKPIGMSNRDWRRLNASFNQGQPISNIGKPRAMGDDMWEKFQEQYNIGLQANQGGDISQIDTLEGSPISQFMGTANPQLSGGLLPTAIGVGGMYLASALHDRNNNPMDSEIRNFTTSPSIIPNYKSGGEVNLELAQTEKGEVYVQEDMTISDVKSKSTHKKMEKDEVTDIFGEGGYVFSDNVKIKKKDSDITFGYSQPLYEEKENKEQVEEINFADLFKKNEKELGSAELAKRIKDKFKIRDEDETYGNPLVEKSNEENRESRVQWLQALVGLTEGAKPPKRKASIEPFIQHFKFGGKVARTPKGTKPTKYQTSNPTIQNIIKRNYEDTLAQQASQRQLYRQNLEGLVSAYDFQNRALALGTVAGIGATLAQDPSETAPDLTATIGAARSRLDRVPNYLRNEASSRLRASTGQAYQTLGEAAPDYATYAAGATNIHANELSQQSQLAAQQNATDIELRNQYLDNLGNVYAQDSQMRAAADNASRTNRNRMISNIGGLATNYLNQVGALRGNRFGTEMALQGQNMAIEGALRSNLNQNALLGAFYGQSSGNNLDLMGVNPTGAPLQEERLNAARAALDATTRRVPLSPMPTTDSRATDFDILAPYMSPFNFNRRRNRDV